MSEKPLQTVFSVGHSNNSIEQFVDLLVDAGITAIADVRSSPYSQFCPQFNREPLQNSLAAVGIAYITMGKEFGARRTERESFVDNKVIFEQVAKASSFLVGIARLKEGAQDYNIALMCSEKDPIDCHRTVLVARNLTLHGFEVQHILQDGTLESMESVSNRIMQASKVNREDLFRSREELLAEAYRIRGAKIAWAESNDAEKEAS